MRNRFRIRIPIASGRIMFRIQMGIRDEAKL